MPTFTVSAPFHIREGAQTRAIAPGSYRPAESNTKTTLSQAAIDHALKLKTGDFAEKASKAAKTGEPK